MTVCVLFCPLHFWFVMRFLVEYVSGGCHLRSFCEITPLLNIRVPIKFYFYLLILSILCHFFVEKCKGASFVWQDLWENWISWEGLLWFTLHWWEGWPGTVTAGITVVKINWKILCNINVHYWFLRSLSKCTLKRIKMTVHNNYLCYGILTKTE